MKIASSDKGIFLHFSPSIRLFKYVVWYNYYKTIRSTTGYEARYTFLSRCQSNCRWAVGIFHQTTLGKILPSS